ncbi:hypothetical protein [Acidipropionibacterium jensenii]|uniref:hypothetical protein n=1 Tax=Acidipropionibacterium jensenii TaxID=1749 RepID=UPI003B8A6D7B
MTGRFTQPDPILDPSDPTQWNAHAYGANNPVDRPDPDGLMPGSPIYCADTCRARTPPTRFTSPTRGSPTTRQPTKRTTTPTTRPSTGPRPEVSTARQPTRANTPVPATRKRESTSPKRSSQGRWEQRSSWPAT